MPRVARIDTHGVNSGMVRTPAEQFFAPRIIPQRAIQGPRIPSVFRSEQAVRQRSALQHARLVGGARGECPDQLQRPIGCTSRQQFTSYDFAFDRDLRDVIP
jgi:hypothetical protein